MSILLSILSPTTVTQTQNLTLKDEPSHLHPEKTSKHPNQNSNFSKKHLPLNTLKNSPPLRFTITAVISCPPFSFLNESVFTGKGTLELPTPPPNTDEDPPTNLVKTPRL